MAREIRYGILSGIFLLFISALFAQAQSPASIPGIPGTLSWQNKPLSSQLDDKNILTISAGPKTDWFVDPFDGTVANNAPILLFAPTSDYVLSAQVAVKFATKWDAGALMLWVDDHHWAKLSYELSPAGVPTLVTVVTRGLSDDCNSKELRQDSVYLRIAKAARPTFCTSRRTATNGKSFAPLAWIPISPFA